MQRIIIIQCFFPVWNASQHFNGFAKKFLSQDGMTFDDFFKLFAGTSFNFFGITPRKIAIFLFSAAGNTTWLSPYLDNDHWSMKLLFTP